MFYFFEKKFWSFLVLGTSDKKITIQDHRMLLVKIRPRSRKMKNTFVSAIKTENM